MAFKSLLGMNERRWEWREEPDAAALWVIDASCLEPAGLSQLLQEHKKQGAHQGVVLASHFPAQAVQGGWTFLKVPLHMDKVFGWIDQCFADRPAQSSAWVPPEQPVRLKVWPNVSRYNSLLDGKSGAIELAAACGQMLAKPCSYPDLRLACPHALLALDALLADAQQQGILTMEPKIASRVSGQVRPNEAPKPTQPPSSGLGWGLVTRLLSKFT